MGKGRPTTKFINWEIFEKLLGLNITQEATANFLDVSVDWLDILCQRKYGETLSAIWGRKRDVMGTRLKMAIMDHIEKGTPGWAGPAVHLHRGLFPDEDPNRRPLQNPDGSNLAGSSGLVIDVAHKASPVKKTFTQFCIDANYFPPYEKQLEMFDFIFLDDVISLLLGARGYGKTDFLTIAGTAYDLYSAWFDKKDMSEHTNLIITKSKSRNTAICEEIANMLTKNGVPLDKANSSVIRVAGLIGQDHSVEAITIKSSMRGRHPKRVIMDDPVTDEDVSEKMRSLVKRRYDEVYKLCKNIKIIGQPAHAHDLYAKLRHVVKTMLVPHGSIPELDADLEAMRMAQIDENSIQMSYMLEVPVSGSAAFAKISRIDKLPYGKTVAFIDPSDGGDFTAITIMLGYFDGVACVGFEWKMAWYHCLDEITKKFKEFDVGRVCFETNCTGTQPILQLREHFKTLGIGVVGKHSDSNKHAVIMQAGSYAPRIHLSKQSGQSYTDHVIQYEYGAEFDDAPDSLARCMEHLGLLWGKK